MAATPLEAPAPSSAVLFDIYNDGLAARDAAPANLPGGPCNYVDLNHGSGGARCGCRRFWSRNPPTAAPGFPGSSANAADHAVWCMCSHHACFHDDLRTHTPQVSAGLPTPAPAGLPVTVGQENERPKTNREPLTPVQDHLPSFHMASNLGLSMDFPGLNVNSSFPANMFDLVPPSLPAGPRDIATNNAATPAHESTLPDTLDWNNVARTPSRGPPGSLPPIPPQCLLPSQSPSTAQSSQGRYMRPFAGKGLQTLGPAKSQMMMKTLPEEAGGAAIGLDSVTGALVETAAGNLNPQDSFDFLDFHGTAATPKALETQDVSLKNNNPAAPMSGPGSSTIQQLSETVQSHEHRLDRLENASFSVAGHEDCHERHEHADLRVTELESRVEEVEKRLNDDNSTVASGRRAGVHDDDATVSVASLSTNATVRYAEQSSEIYSQLQALQAQVNSLQASSLPTYHNPWELEVVFLPFPLKGIWMEAQHFATQQQSGRGADADDWTQLPSTLSRQTPEPQSPFMYEWSDQGVQNSWLLPRACAPGRMIDKRLKSRGLIKTLSVRGSDARSLQQAMASSFGSTLRTIPHKPASSSSSRRASTGGIGPLSDKFLGLQQPWIPLRKVHKDSRLRFLSPAEMLTPALWDAAFLMSSVVMRASGMHRLYVTQPEAYVQDYRAYEAGWSWHKLRELSRVYPDSQTSSGSGSGSGSSFEVPEADAAEECWAWNDRLDESPVSAAAAGGGLSLRQAQAAAAAAAAFNRSRSSGSSSQQYFTGRQSPILSTSPVAAAAARAGSPSLVMKGRHHVQRPPHVRTSSMPPAVLPTATATSSILSPAAVLSPAAGQAKRRVASYSTAAANPYHERRSSPFPGAGGGSSSRPSPRVQSVHSPVLLTTAAAISKRRRGATRSPSLRPRTTPRWSMSRSPSLAPFPPPEHAGARGTTPFCYATPFSNAPADLASGRQQQMAGGGAVTGAGMRIFDDDDDDDDDDDMDYDGDDRGSSTDPYGSEMGGREYDDIEVYEDGEEEDMLDRLDGNRGGRGVQAGAGAGAGAGGMGPRLPEDEPWPGIEDGMSDGENMDPMSLAEGEEGQGQGQASQGSSAPSEYPSTQRAWLIAADAERAALDDPNGFRIHEDHDDDDDDDEVTGVGGDDEDEDEDEQVEGALTQW
ncbi:uncharacterized protein E0L32_002370 [Thyridium curvatum]|uniref:Uncharacterized protein n=1 Tax=Thyridium curvatum TaxID=1093900 RepID=A0A507ALA0_9PEZI|nr:uncharacterized protein E0L32_002370 [Thyridium curvatum]TPX06874.1 hypothetical protein E0L32_002370 [Thyridium curvatum]